MSVLVVGGAGYIGSHTCIELKNSKYNVIVYDNLSHGFKKSVEGFKFIEGDTNDESKLSKVFEENEILAVIHFGGLISVGDSSKDPLGYFENNFVGTMKILKVMQKFNCKYIIFSSTAAIFGQPEQIPIQENDIKNPINPYGETKLCVEKMLKWCDQCLGIKYVSLRYFNACGAHESGEIGESHNPETHLIPIVLQVALNQRKKISIFGNDYKTKDGTCVRDYIHVTDLANAHVNALKYLEDGGDSNHFNLGSGNGFSVKEVIEVCRKVTGHLIPEEIVSRREGDPDYLIATSEKAEKVLKWNRKYDTLEKIIESAWKWHKNNPNGY